MILTEVDLYCIINFSFVHSDEAKHQFNAFGEVVFFGNDMDGSEVMKLEIIVWIEIP